ncbi:MAG: 50S ribosomal protein L19e [Candidatus Freyarchaeum deiterrae]
MNLRAQRKMAASILKVGENRIWIDPENIDNVSMAIRKEDVRALIRSKAIRARGIVGTSRGRTRNLTEKKRKGQRRGEGKRRGAKYSRITRKRLWINRIRPIRRVLRAMRSSKTITPTVHRRLYLLAKGGTFRNTAHIKSYIKEQKLAKRR